jgi:uncharacterized protein with NAD-binding domain and iron-sulfur cluster
MPRKRIVILGGGIASLVTAFELTSSPDWKSKYQITLYQQGHRLGGKCASSRLHRQYGSGYVERIEEHGLHVFFGFYENAFGVMRRAYAEHELLPRLPGEQKRLTFDTAFLPHDLVMLGTDLGSTLHRWTLPFPRRDGEPGVADSTNPTSLDGGTAIAGLVELLVAQWLTVADVQVDGLGALKPGNHELDKILSSVKDDGVDEDLIVDTMRIMRGVTRVLRGSVNPADVVRAMRATQVILARLVRLSVLRRKFVRGAVSKLLYLLRDAALVALAPLPQGEFRAHELRISVDLALTLAAGLVAEDLLHPDVDWHALDGEDYRTWLARHGAREETVRSAPLLTLAAAAFSDPVNAGAGAGTTLRLTLRLLLTYKHAVVFRLGAGMGEMAIAPLYRVLAERGVEFRFFRRVERLVPGRHGREPVLSRIELRVQASERGGPGSYRPLLPFAGLMCWPEHPDYAQLEEGETLRRSGESLENSWNRWDPERPVESLELGRDYDVAVLGISHGGLKVLAQELAADADTRPPLPRGPRSYAPRLSEMLGGVRTVETMAVQLWFDREFRALGAAAHRGIGIAYPQPFDTWAEMDHLLQYERWHVPEEPASLVYLCSAMDEPADYEPPPFDDHDHPQRQKDLVKRTAKRWLNEHGSRVFSAARLPGGGFDFDMLVDPANRSGEARFDAQYHCATTNPSDRYVLAAPGTTRHRLRPHESGFVNVILAGDWTLNSISAGCVESAVTSGKDAARALIGDSVKIVDDWLTRVKPWLLCEPLLGRLPSFGAGESAEAEVRVALRQPMRPQLREIAGGAEAASALDMPRDSGVRSLAKPGYMQRSFDVLPRPPFVCKDTRTDWFFFRARRDALQDLCDEFLNFEQSPTEYRPLAPMVAFVAAQCGYIYPDRERLGYMPERDYAFWVPVVATAKPGREAEHRASPIAWLQVVLWVDSSPALVGGRDTFGMNKVLGELRAPFDAGAAGAKFSVDTVAVQKQGVLNDQGEPMSRWQMERIFELRVDQELDVWDALSSFAGLRDAIAGRFDLGSLGGEEHDWLSSLFEQLREQNMPLVMLKQIPDIEHADRACYKAVVEAPSRLVELRSVRPWPGSHELVIFPFDSHPIAQRFGLTVESRDQDGVEVQVAQSFFAVTMQFDFTIEEGKVICDLTRAHAEAAAPRAAAE